MQAIDLSQFDTPADGSSNLTGRQLLVLGEDHLPESVAYLRSEGFKVFVSEAIGLLTIVAVPERHEWRAVADSRN